MEPLTIGLIILIIVILVVIYKRTEGFWGGLDYRRSNYPYYYQSNYPYYYYPSIYPYYYPYYNYYYTPCIETVDGTVVCEN